MWAGNSLLMALRMSFALGIRREKGHFKRLPPEKAPLPTHTDSGSAAFVYVVYIAASPEAVWKALLDPETTVKYWQHVNLSEWKIGSKWEHRENSKDGELKLSGKVVEASPPQRLVITWADPIQAQSGRAS